MNGFAGKVAIVTGAGRGIGRAIALEFAGRGATVVLTGRTAADLNAVRREITAFGTTALALPANVSEEDSVTALVRQVLDEFGTVDILCANSGIAGPTAPLWEITPQEWQQTFAVNVFGTYLCCRTVLPTMVERGSGSIVVIGSVTGKKPLAGRTPYAASKAALVGMTRTLAMEAGEYGVRVNLVSPGAVQGPRLDTVVGAQAEQLGLSAEEVRARMLADAPLRDFVTAADVAGTVAFLAGEEAKAITGQDVNVSGGAVMY